MDPGTVVHGSAPIASEVIDGSNIAALRSEYDCGLGPELLGILAMLALQRARRRA